MKYIISKREGEVEKRFVCVECEDGSSISLLLVATATLLSWRTSAATAVLAAQTTLHDVVEHQLCLPIIHNKRD